MVRTGSVQCDQRAGWRANKLLNGLCYGVNASAFPQARQTGINSHLHKRCTRQLRDATLVLD